MILCSCCSFLVLSPFPTCNFRDSYISTKRPPFALVCCVGRREVIERLDSSISHNFVVPKPGKKSGKCFRSTSVVVIYLFCET